MGKDQRGATERRERESGAHEREQERMGGREWERDPQSKRRGLTGAKGGGFELTRVNGTPRQHGTVKW